ncbi:MAG: oligopeptide/dipeptide ABC transporter ATP-binding protein [Pseudomonadota bacterium]
MNNLAQEPLISVQGLKVHFPIRGKNLFGGVQGYVKACDGVSFDIRQGETLGLVGESGSGKTTIGRAVLRAISATDGHVSFKKNGTQKDLLSLRGEELRLFRKHMQLIFQDPYSSLNPRMTVRDIIAEPLEALGLETSKDAVDDRVREVAARCKLNVEHLRRFPHAFSGGQRQRICIARALVSQPDFVVCDESVSALDVSIQAEILNLLADLQQELGLAYLFIAHDLSVVAHIAHRIAVLYVGKMVELAPSKSLFAAPKHPYTKALMSAIPQVSREIAFNPEKLVGEIPNPADVPSGCRFHTRCPYAQDACKTTEPEWRQIGDEHFVACHFAEELADAPSAH